MKKLALLGLVVLVAGLGALMLSFTSARLPITAEGAGKTALTSARPPAGMKMGALSTGRMFSAAALTYRGGSFSDERVFSMTSVVVQHPKGTLLFDGGWGRNLDTHVVIGTPWIMRKTSRYEKDQSIADQLAAAGIPTKSLMAVVLTHTHWDHVSGLEDLPGTPVWVGPRELEFANSDHPMTLLARRIGTQNYKAITFASGPYLGFEASHDVFGDGSVVLVQAGGHTPGSLIAFIQTPDDRHYALIGDLAWQAEGVDLPAEKPWFVRTMVQEDEAALRAVLVKLHTLKAKLPGLVIVPAHDQRVLETLPKLRPAAGT